MVSKLNLPDAVPNRQQGYTNGTTVTVSDSCIGYLATSSGNLVITAWNDGTSTFTHPVSAGDKMAINIKTLDASSTADAILFFA